MCKTPCVLLCLSEGLPYRALKCHITLVQVLRQDVGKAVNILSDILQNSHMSKAAIERERSVILRESEEVRIKGAQRSPLLRMQRGLTRSGGGRRVLC